MLLADLHIHTIMSGHAFCTINECIETALNNEMALIAITDHGPSMEHSAHEGYFEMSARLPKRFGSLDVLFGCEANIINCNGVIDLSVDTMSVLDVVSAGLHKKTPYDGISEADNTNAMIKAIEKYPGISMISHPFRVEFPVSVEEVVYASIEHNVLLEINVALLTKVLISPVNERSKKVIERTATMIDILQANKKGYLINSDAHHTNEIGVNDSTIELLSKALGISREYILNDNLDLLGVYIPSVNMRRLTE